MSRGNWQRLAAESRCGIFCCALWILAGALAPWLAPFDPWQPSGPPCTPPGWPHLLGTNDLGQDLFSEILYGLRLSLAVGLGGAGLATLVGALVGLTAGYCRGPVDEALMGLTDVVMLVPGLPLLIVLVAYVGPGLEVLIGVIGLVWWTGTARAVRARAVQVREQSYVEAARALGGGSCRLVLVHVLPNALPVILAQLLMAVPEAILAEAGLSFLGLGDPVRKSLGLSLKHAFAGGSLVNEYWWWYVFPALAIALVVMSVALIGLGWEER